MPVLSFEAEFTGRPIVELYVSMAAKDIKVLRDAGGQAPGSLLVKALVDTGATQSQVDLAVLTLLGLDLAGETDVYTASTGPAPERRGFYTIDLHLAGERTGVLASNLEVIGSDRLGGLSVGMLLGRDILDRCLMVYDGLHHRFTLAYNVSSQRPED